MSRDDFRPGDRVEAVAPSYGPDYVPVGALGVVVRTYPVVAVAFDHSPSGDGTGTWAMLPSQVAPVARTRAGRWWLRHRWLRVARDYADENSWSLA